MFTPSQKHAHIPAYTTLCQLRTQATRNLNTSENAPSSNKLLTIHTALHAPKLRKRNQVIVKIKGILMPWCKNIWVPKIQPRCATDNLLHRVQEPKLRSKPPHFLIYLPHSTLKKLTALETKCYSITVPFTLPCSYIQPRNSGAPHFPVSILVLPKQTWIRSTICYNSRYLEAFDITASASSPAGLCIVATEGSPRLVRLMCSLEPLT